MFQRFSEPARRVVFFGRYEASRLGGSSLTTAHLLLGLLRENSWLVEPLLPAGRTLRDLQRETERAAGSRTEKVAPSQEMRLSEAAKRALTYAEEEADRLMSSTIDVPHLLLGLLRAEGSKAASLLAQFGLEVDDVRLKVVQGTVTPVQEVFGVVVCAFYGIEIRLDAGAEAVPTFIAQYRGRITVVEINPLRVIQTDLPPRAQSMVMEWAAVRTDEITAAWEGAKAGKRPLPIPPLE
ncbi:MAG: DUF4160 domain-containing protein [Acidobacteria bacterium]|nr:MAG: DUF4160 domain-containing protein [Acidobacteriota bacterium]